MLDRNSHRRPKRALFSLTVLSATAMVAGCTSFEPLRPDLAARSVPSRLDEIAYINALREAFILDGPAGCYDGKELKHFRPTLEQGRPDHTAEQETVTDHPCVTFADFPADEPAKTKAITRYLDAGFGLTDLYCQRYFVIAVESDRKRQFQRNMGATGDSLVNAVLGFASASTRAVALSNAGFEAFDSTYQNIQDAFMVSPDLALTRKLVHSAQRDLRKQVDDKRPENYLEARSVIERYAGTCSYSGMKQLVNDSVAAQTKELDDSAKQKADDPAGAPAIPPAAPAPAAPVPQPTETPAARVQSPLS